MYNKIQSIKILKTAKTYWIGMKGWNVINAKGDAVEYEITEIRDVSESDGETFYFPAYDIWSNGKKFKRIENTEVEITYFI